MTAALAPDIEQVAGATLAGRLAALDRAVELCRGRLEPEVLDRAAAVSARADQRLRLSGEHTVAALAGATGSGKSALFNVIAGLELSPTGVTRPTTAHAVACVWGADGAQPLLDWLGVTRRHRLPGSSDDRELSTLAGLVLLDLPDHDSTEVEHRLEVDRLVQLVDLLVWVFDPQKYADAALHEGYLRPLATHAPVTLCVFNQVDRLDPAVIDACVADLRRLLTADGLAGVPVVAASARAGHGLDDLRTILGAVVKNKRARRDRLLADVGRAAGELAAQCGAGRTRQTSRTDSARLITALGHAAGVPAVVHAVGAAHRYRGGLATGWPLTRWLRRLRPDPLRRLGLGSTVRRQSGERSPPVVARTSLPPPGAVARAEVDTALRTLGDSAARGLPSPWADAVRRSARADEPELIDALDHAVAEVNLGGDRPPRWWRLAGAVQWLFAGLLAAGLIWLAVLAAFGLLQVPEPPTPQWRGWPIPTLLTIGGAGGGLIVALVARQAVRLGARRRRRRTNRRLGAAVENVADRLVLDPIGEELARYRDAHASVSAALG